MNICGRSILRFGRKFHSTPTSRLPVDPAKRQRMEQLHALRRRNPEEGRFYRMVPASWKSVLLTSVMCVGGVLYYHQTTNKKIEMVVKSSQYGRADIGGPFELVDTEGKLVSSKDFEGKWMLLYFGFTMCPDICPTELDKLTTVISQLEKSRTIGDVVVPLFISVDPKRDDPKAVKEYIRDFHPRLIGLTGDEDQVGKAARAFRVYFSTNTQSADEENYLVDHSIVMYLMDPEGNFVDFFGQSMRASEMVERIKYLVWSRTEPSMWDRLLDRVGL
eukprot:Rmarinus@m.4499